MSQYANNTKGHFFNPSPGPQFQHFVGDNNYQIPETGDGWQWGLYSARGVPSAKAALNEIIAY